LSTSLFPLSHPLSWCNFLSPEKSYSIPLSRYPGFSPRDKSSSQAPKGTAFDANLSLYSLLSPSILGFPVFGVDVSWSCFGSFSVLLAPIFLLWECSSCAVIGSNPSQVVDFLRFSSAFRYLNSGILGFPVTDFNLGVWLLMVFSICWVFKKKNYFALGFCLEINNFPHFSLIF